MSNFLRIWIGRIQRYVDCDESIFPAGGIRIFLPGEDGESTVLRVHVDKEKK